MINFTIFYFWLVCIGLSIVGLAAQFYYFNSDRGAYICLLTMIPISTAFILLLQGFQ